MEPPSTGGQSPLETVASAEVLLPCSNANFDASLAFFNELGFRVLDISPADAPTSALLVAYGLRLRLEVCSAETASVSGLTLRLRAPDPTAVLPGRMHATAPNGVTVVIAPAVTPVAIPPQPPVADSFVMERSEASGGFHAGRAGLLYRDLLPSRLGGRAIASLIRVTNDGPVTDYVHFHRVAFQVSDFGGVRSR